MQGGRDAGAWGGLCSTTRHTQRRLQQLDELEAATGQVAHCCQAARAALLDGGTVGSDAVSSAEGVKHQRAVTTEESHRVEGELQAAVARLRRLLDDFVLAGTGTCLPEAKPATSASTSDRRLLPGHSSSTFPLLALPGELLSSVARAAGKGARLGCRQLWEAYGCPGGTLRQPVPEGHVVGDLDSLEHRADQISDMVQDVEGFDTHVLRALRGLCPPDNCWGVLQQLNAHWPGHVTRVELSNDFIPDMDLLRALHSTLPHLRELKCAWPEFWDSTCPVRQNVPDARVPCFAALTALTTMCSLPYAVECTIVDREAFHMFDAAQVVALAPNLRSLEADLRWQVWDSSLLQLTRLSCLTNLRLLFNDHSEHAPPEFSRADHLLAILASTADRLCSLSLENNRAWAEAGAAVQAMSRLTSLALFDASELTPGCLPSWQHLPQLLLGYSRHEWHCMPSVFANTLHSSMQAGLPTGLTDVSLPAALLVDVHVHPLLQDMLAMLQSQCKGLTSLTAGCSAAGEHLPPLPLPWLGPAGGMRQLQRLALILPVVDMGQLECLSAVPLLSTLWLHLQFNALDPSAGATAAAVLGRLAAVRDVTLLLVPTPAPAFQRTLACDPIVAALLAAAAEMPALQVLDTLGLVAYSSSCAPWQAFASCPPRSLLWLILRAQSSTEHYKCRSCVPLDCAAAAVSSILPARVHVSTLPGWYGGNEDRILPWTFERP